MPVLNSFPSSSDTCLRTSLQYWRISPALSQPGHTVTALADVTHLWSAGAGYPTLTLTEKVTQVKYDPFCPVTFTYEWQGFGNVTYHKSPDPTSINGSYLLSCYHNVNYAFVLNGVDITANASLMGYATTTNSFTFNPINLAVGDSVITVTATPYPDTAILTPVSKIFKISKLNYRPTIVDPGNLELDTGETKSFILQALDQEGESLTGVNLTIPIGSKLNLSPPIVTITSAAPSPTHSSLKLDFNAIKDIPVGTYNVSISVSDTLGYGNVSTVNLVVKSTEQPQTFDYGKSGKAVAMTTIGVIGASSAMAGSFNSVFWSFVNFIQLARTTTVLQIPTTQNLREYLNYQLQFFNFQIPTELVYKIVFNYEFPTYPVSDERINAEFEEYDLQNVHLTQYIMENIFLLLVASLPPLFVIWVVFKSLAKRVERPKVKKVLTGLSNWAFHHLFIRTFMRFYLEYDLDLVLTSFLVIFDMSRHDAVDFGVSLTLALCNIILSISLALVNYVVFCRLQYLKAKGKVKVKKGKIEYYYGWREVWLDSHPTRPWSVSYNFGWFIGKRLFLALNCAMFHQIQGYYQATFHNVVQLLHFIPLLIIHPHESYYARFVNIMMESNLAALFMSLFVFQAKASDYDYRVRLGEIMVTICIAVQQLIGLSGIIYGVFQIIMGVRKLCRKYSILKRNKDNVQFTDMFKNVDHLDDKPNEQRGAMYKSQWNNLTNQVPHNSTSTDLIYATNQGSTSDSVVPFDPNRVLHVQRTLRADKKKILERPTNPDDPNLVKVSRKKRKKRRKRKKQTIMTE